MFTHLMWSNYLIQMLLKCFESKNVAVPRLLVSSLLTASHCYKHRKKKKKNKANLSFPLRTTAISFWFLKVKWDKLPISRKTLKAEKWPLCKKRKKSWKQICKISFEDFFWGFKAEVCAAKKRIEFKTNRFGLASFHSKAKNRVSLSERNTKS